MYEKRERWISTNENRIIYSFVNRTNMVNLPRIVVYWSAIRKEGGDIFHVYLSLFELTRWCEWKRRSVILGSSFCLVNYLCHCCWSGYLVCAFCCSARRRMIRCLLFTFYMIKVSYSSNVPHTFEEENKVSMRNK